MTKQAMRAALAGVLLLGAWAQPVWAGTWEHTFNQADFRIDQSWLVAGATRTQDTAGNRYISFPATTGASATAEYNIPSFLSATTMSCKIYGRINSNTITNNIGFGITSLTTPTGALWESNLGQGPSAYSAVIQPGSSAKLLIVATVPSVLMWNQTLNLQCTVGTQCAGLPSRLNIFRDSAPTGTDDPAAFELIKVVCTGTTN